MNFSERISYLSSQTPNACLIVDNVTAETDDPAKVTVYGPCTYPEFGIWYQLSEDVVRTYNSENIHDGIRENRFVGQQRATCLHRHEYIEIGYVVKGCAHQRFSGKDYFFPEGSFWFCDRNCAHIDLLNGKELFTVFIKLSDELFDSIRYHSEAGETVIQFIQLMLSNQKKLRQFLCFVPKGEYSAAEHLMENICDEIESRQVGYLDVVKGLVTRLLVTLSQDYVIQLECQDRFRTSRRLFDEVESYLRRHFQNVTIQDLVQKFHYNENYYNQIIKENTGLTYLEYLQKLKLDYASHMLKETKIPVEQVMAQVGYSNKGHFYRLFSEQYQMTPAQYRKAFHTLTETP